jgi:hypothetical protein
MFDGPIDVHAAVPGAGGAALNERARARVRAVRLARGCDADTLFAAFDMAAANALAAGGVLFVRALPDCAAFARSPSSADPTRGRAAFGTVIDSTASAMSIGSRWARYVRRRCNALPPCGDLRLLLPFAAASARSSILLLIVDGSSSWADSSLQVRRGSS